MVGTISDISVISFSMSNSINSIISISVSISISHCLYLYLCLWRDTSESEENVDDEKRVMTHAFHLHCIPGYLCGT